MASGLHDSQVSNPVLRWIDQRLPVITMIQKEYGVFPTPRNFNYFWNFGALAMINLMVMIATGIFLAMNYTPHTAMAFDSVERIMRRHQSRSLSCAGAPKNGSSAFVRPYATLNASFICTSSAGQGSLKWRTASP